MRRLAVICATTAIVFGILTVRNAKENREVLAASPQAAVVPAPASAPAAGAVTGSTTPSKGASGIASASKVSVVASNVAARALALNPFDSSVTIDLTTTSAPNQVFALGVAAPSGAAAANARLIAIAGTGAAGSLGDGGAATSAQLNLISASIAERSGVAVGTDGTIFLADTENATIRAIGGASSSEPGVIRSIAGKWAARQSVTLAEPLGIALDRAGNAYVADHAAGAVIALSLANDQLATLAHIASPASIAVAPNGGTVFVASPENGQVFAINTQTKAIDVVLGAAATSSSEAGTPQSGSACASSDGATPAAQPQICPSGLAVDGAGNLFVGDAVSGRILRMDAKTGAQSTAASGLNQPGALAFDASGNLYVAEQGMSRIVAFAQAGAAQSNITISPASAAFGNAPTGGASATQQLTLTNTSSATAVTGLTIPKSTTPADFTVESNNCTATLAANSSCALNIAFTPTATGARSGSLAITDATSTDSATASLTGTGADYEIQLAANQLMSISVQTGAAATFNLQVVPDNIFSGTVTLVCPDNLPTNTTCTFSSSIVNVSPGVAAPFQVTFQTTGVVNPIQGIAPGGRDNGPRFFQPFPALAMLAALFLAAMMMVLAAMVRTNGKAATRSLATVLLVFALAAIILAGCHSVPVNKGLGPTPPGQTSMQITGTSQNTSRALTITLSVVQL